MKTSGYLISWERDADDPVKVTGKTEDGDIYVSELTDDEMTDEECNAYYARKGISEETFDSKVIDAGEYLKDCPDGTWSC